VICGSVVIVVRALYAFDDRVSSRCASAGRLRPGSGRRRRAGQRIEGVATVNAAVYMTLATRVSHAQPEWARLARILLAAALAGLLAWPLRGLLPIASVLAGGTVLVVGHSNTIPAIVGALGAPQPKELCDSEYDQVFTVVLGDTGPPRLIRSRYGAPSAEDTTCNSMSR
jgi:hypothetical protein